MDGHTTADLGRADTPLASGECGPRVFTEIFDDDDPRETFSEWFDAYELEESASASVDTKKPFHNRAILEEDRNMRHLIQGGGYPVAAVKAGRSSFIVFDTRTSDRFRSPFLLVQEPGTAMDASRDINYKGIWANKPLVVGRAQHYDRFPDAKNDVTLSRQHFAVHYDSQADSLRVTDLASSNGTVLMGNLFVENSQRPSRLEEEISSNFTRGFQHIVQQELARAGLLSKEQYDDTAPYGYYRNHPIIGRASPTVRNGVYGVQYSERVVVDDDTDSMRRVVAGSFNVINHECLDTRDERSVLHAIRRYTADVLRYDLEKVDEICEPYNASQDTIELSQFVEAGVGVCRQQALLAALLAEGAAARGLLPKGRAFVERNHRKGKGAHVWMVYSNADDASEIIVDPAQDFVGTRQQARREERWRYEV